VEAPNDHLFLKRVHEAVEPVNVLVAEVDAARCTGCGQCRDSCAYGAVRLLGGPAIVFEELCHGCGSCLDVCAAGAMAEVPRCVGEVLSGPVEVDGVLTLVTGRLDVGQVKSPAVIRQHVRLRVSFQATSWCWTPTGRGLRGVWRGPWRGCAPVGDGAHALRPP